MTNLKYFATSFLLLFLAVGLITGCKQYANHVVHNLFPHPPDTSNLLKLGNFISTEDLAYIVGEKTTLINGKTRKKGIVSVPQDGDDFRGHSLDEVYWNRVSVVDGDFRGNFFRSAHCTNSDFSHSDFRVADIQWANFGNSVLKVCNFDQAKMFHVHANDADFTGSSFEGTNMFGMDGHNVNLRNCNFSNALMKDTEFLDSDLTGSKALKVNFIRAVLIGSKADSADFSYSEFIGAGLEGVSFINSRFIDVNFQGAHLQDTDFSGADLTGCNFFGAEFVNTAFIDAVNIPEALKKIIVDDHYTGILNVGRSSD